MGSRALPGSTRRPSDRDPEPLRRAAAVQRPAASSSTRIADRTESRGVSITEDLRRHGHVDFVRIYNFKTNVRAVCFKPELKKITRTSTGFRNNHYLIILSYCFCSHCVVYFTTKSGKSPLKKRKIRSVICTLCFFPAEAIFIN